MLNSIQEKPLIQSSIYPPQTPGEQQVALNSALRNDVAFAGSGAIPAPAPCGSCLQGAQAIHSVIQGLCMIFEQVLSLISAFKSIFNQPETAQAQEPAAPTSTNTAPADSSASAGSQAPSTSTGLDTIKPSDEFLWKPASEKDGNLVVLLPGKMSGKVKKVRVLSANGRKSLASGRYSGIGNGDREHYRFSKPGSRFPKNAIVEISLKDGTIRNFTVKSPGVRVAQ